MEQPKDVTSAACGQSRSTVELGDFEPKFLSDSATNGANCNPDPFNLTHVVMPIVRLMKDGHMSWAQREECGLALQECLRQHRSLMKEHWHHQQAACGAQQKAPNAKVNGAGTASAGLPG